MPGQSTRRTNRGGRTRSAARSGRTSSRKMGQSRVRSVRPTRAKRSARMAGRTAGSRQMSRRRPSAARSRRKPQRGTQGSARPTTDHDTIQNWAEERDGWPAMVEGGILRIDFPGFKGEGKLRPVSWDEWFRIFDERDLKFLYQDRTSDGKISRFFKLVDR